VGIEGDEMTTDGVAHGYPLTVDIDKPPSRARSSVLARLPLALPVLFFSVLLNVGATLATWAAILVSGRIPSWLFAFQVNVGRWRAQWVPDTARPQTREELAASAWDKPVLPLAIASNGRPVNRVSACQRRLRAREDGGAGVPERRGDPKVGHLQCAVPGARERWRRDVRIRAVSNRTGSGYAGREGCG
jgi:hypothetical protein